MAVYVCREGKFVDKKTGEPLLTEDERNSTELCLPYIRGDLPGYKSPATGQWVEGRAARREDLKRSGCREVDPSEFKPVYKNYRFCQKHRKPYLGGDVPPPMTRDEKMAAQERKAKEQAQALSIDPATPYVRSTPVTKDAHLKPRGFTR